MNLCSGDSIRVTECLSRGFTVFWQLQRRAYCYDHEAEQRPEKEKQRPSLRENNIKNKRQPAGRKYREFCKANSCNLSGF